MKGAALPARPAILRGYGAGVEGFNILPRSAGPLLLKKEDNIYCLPFVKGVALVLRPAVVRGRGI